MQVVIKWLDSIITTLQSESGPATQLMSAVCIVWCLSKLDIPLCNPAMKSLTSDLLGLLCISGERDNSDRWIEYDICRQYLLHKSDRYVMRCTKLYVCTISQCNLGIRKKFAVLFKSYCRVT